MQAYNNNTNSHCHSSILSARTLLVYNLESAGGNYLFESMMLSNCIVFFSPSRVLHKPPHMHTRSHTHTHTKQGNKKEWKSPVGLTVNHVLRLPITLMWISDISCLSNQPPWQFLWICFESFRLAEVNWQTTLRSFAQICSPIALTSSSTPLLHLLCTS